MPTRRDFVPPAPASDGYPRWVMLLKKQSHTKYGADVSSWPSTVDARTAAAARTSTGEPIRVCFRLAAPPARSRMYVDLPDVRSALVAAHRDSILIEINDRDYFVYRAGAGGGPSRRPPTLSLLPPCDVPRSGRIQGYGILRRGDDGFLVAALALGVDATVEAELCVLRSGQWEVKRLPIHRRDKAKQGEELDLHLWSISDVVPVAGRWLLWADNSRGVIVADLSSEESPELHYAPLPLSAPPYTYNTSQLPSPSSSGRVSVTDGGTAVKFVEVYRVCCCGGPVERNVCPRRGSAFRVATWSLSMHGMMTWEKVGAMDASELRALDGEVSAVRA